MSKAKMSAIPSQQPGCGWSMYHENIFGALVRSTENYGAVWVDVQRGCKTALDFKIVAGSDEVEEAAIPVILLAHAMVEALANWYFAMSCSKKDFERYEDESLVDKWRSIPRRWLPKYDLPEKHEVCRDLRALIGRRKRITHHRAFIEANEQVVHAGDQRNMSAADVEFVKRVSTLPLRLIEHVKKFDSAPFLEYCTITLERKAACVLQGMRRERRRATGGLQADRTSKRDSAGTV